MSDQGTFGELMARLRAGDSDVAAEVFRRFTRRLIALASDQFDTWVRDRADPEGIAQSVYKSFFTRFGQGQFDLNDWDELWGLLTVITLRKCAKRRDYLRAGRRDAARDLRQDRASDAGDGCWQAIDREPSPVEAAMLSESVDQLLRRYEPPERQIVELSLQGWSTQEIAGELGRSERTVRRIREHVKGTLEQMRSETEKE